MGVVGMVWFGIVGWGESTHLRACAWDVAGQGGPREEKAFKNEREA